MRSRIACRKGVPNSIAERDRGWGDYDQVQVAGTVLIASGEGTEQNNLLG